MFADWNPTCLSCLLQLNANADHLNGLSSCQDAARSSVADHRNTNSPLERWRSQERTAAAHGQNEPYSTTGFYLWLHWSKEWRERSKSFVLVKPPSPLSRPHFPPLSSLCFIANKKQKFMFCFFSMKSWLNTQELQPDSSHQAALIYNQLVRQSHHKLIMFNWSCRVLLPYPAWWKWQQSNRNLRNTTAAIVVGYSQIHSNKKISTSNVRSNQVYGGPQRDNAGKHGIMVIAAALTEGLSALFPHLCQR